MTKAAMANGIDLVPNSINLDAMSKTDPISIVLRGPTLSIHHPKLSIKTAPIILKIVRNVPT